MSRRNVPSAARRRCAIYTRKSTDEGLEQSFNSLDAQREACAAFILSQAHEGWERVPEYYDDGGYSGGSMNRPGIQQLMADVAAGKVDVIVVYKVDRLTRSLADFAKIVEVLDAQGASFVSVTQAFNTTNSMGRLTLNVLLSFAQFEREVTGERIRDKIAASKARGMWMGGVVPLGYAVHERKLVVLPDEAERVRHIFTRYLALRSVGLLQTELAGQGIRTKARIGRDGRHYGDAIFSRGALYQMLRNRIYLGEICHRGKAHAGEHDAIVDGELFDQVAAMLDGNRADSDAAVHADQPALLTGVLWDGEGRRMTPNHASKRGVRYRYYVSRRDKERLQLPLWRVPAGELEKLVAQQVMRHTDTIWSGTLPSREQMLGAIERVTLEPETITVILADHAEPIVIPAQLISRSGERRISAPRECWDNDRKDPALIKLIVRAHQARTALAEPATASVAAAATSMGVSVSYFASLLRLAHLAPDITTAILDGRQPAHLNRMQLAKLNNLPSGWAEQRQMLGFTQAA